MTVLDVARGRDPAGSSTSGRTVRAGAEFNIADVAVDHHVRAGHGDDVAIRWIGRDRADLDDPLDITFSMLERRSSRFASALHRHGVAAGTVVSTVLGRVPDLYLAALGTWKAGCVFAALSDSSGPGPTADRLAGGRVGVVITSPTLFRRTLAPVLDRLPDLELVLICGASEDQTARSTIRPGSGPLVMSCGAFLCEGIDAFDVEAVDPDAPATLHFTGDPNGAPEFAVHPHAPARDAGLDLRAGETFWNTTDPVWVTGVADDLTAALGSGATSIVDEAEFDPMRSLHILANRDVDVLYTSAAALRLLHGAAPDHRPLAHPLRVVATIDEPLDPATSQWAAMFLGTAVRERPTTTSTSRSAKM
jgi:acetyl-CoA synthetase